MRVLVTATTVLLGSLALLGLGLDTAFKRTAQTAEYQRLEGLIYSLLAVTEVDTQGRVEVGSPRDKRLDLINSGLYAVIQGAGGRVWWRSPSALGHPLQTIGSDDASGRSPEAALPLLGRQPVDRWRFADVALGETARYFVTAYGVEWLVGPRAEPLPLTITVIADARGYRQQLADFRLQMSRWLAALATLVLVAQWLSLEWGLRPLRRVRQELSQIESGERNAIGGHYAREIDQLTQHINELIQHERDRQARYRDSLGELAHSLKTPLSILRHQVSRGNSGTHPDGRLAEQQLERMQAIVDRQLQRAATHGPLHVGATRVALRPLIERLIEALRKVHHQRPLRFEYEGPNGLMVAADAGDLMELLGNLMDNAAKWAGSKVRIHAEPADHGAVRITIADDGPGIPPAKRHQIIVRGGRSLSAPAVDGQGIGLAVALDIVSAYGGSLDLDNDPRLGGALVTIIVPGAPGVATPARTMSRQQSR